MNPETLGSMNAVEDHTGSETALPTPKKILDVGDRIIIWKGWKKRLGRSEWTSPKGYPIHPVQVATIHRVSKRGAFFHSVNKDGLPYEATVSRRYPLAAVEECEDAQRHVDSLDDVRGVMRLPSARPLRRCLLATERDWRSLKPGQLREVVRWLDAAAGVGLSDE